MAKLTAWERLEIVRNKHRPTVKDFTETIRQLYAE